MQVKIMPSLTIETELLQEGCQVLTDAIAEVLREQGFRPVPIRPVEGAVPLSCGQ